MPRSRLAWCVLLALALAVCVQAQSLPEASFDEAQKVWRLSNGLVDFELRLTPNNLLRVRNFGRTGGRQWVTNSRPAMSPVYVRAGNTVINSNTTWELVATRQESAGRNGLRHVLQLRSAEDKAEIGLRIEIHPGQPFIRTWYTYRNIGEQGRFINEARLFNYRLNAERQAIQAFWVEQYRQGTPLMFNVHQTDLRSEPDGVLVSGGAHADHCTWLALRDGTDEGLALGWEFNGRAAVRAQIVADGTRLEINGGPEYLNAWVGPDREFRAPAGFIGVFQGDWDEAGYRTHRYVETVLAAPLPDDNFPYFMFNTWGYRQDMNETTLRRAAQIAASVGVEVFVVDLGWSRSIGDWEDDSSKFPSGLAAFGDYVRSLGMKLGLHFVPVEAAPESPVLQLNPQWTSTENNNYYGAVSMCISNGPAHNWIRDALSNVLDRYRPEWITQDAENLVKSCTKTGHTHNWQNSNWSNSVNGIDALVKYSRARWPQTFWENNADGGTMSTFEAVKNYATFGGCDACEHMPRRQVTWGMTYAFPPRFIDRYMEEPPIKFTTRSSMFGGPWILMQQITRWTQAEIDLVRSEAAIYKALRPLLRRGKVFHLTPRPTGFQNEAIESFDPEGDRGVIFVYRPDTPNASETVVPRGLRPERGYRITFQEARDVITATGADLMQRGIPVRLPNKNFAEIVYINPQ